MNHTKFICWLPALTLASALLTGCTSSVPDAIRIAPDSEILISTVQRTPKIVVGSQVRWGGNIISVDNKPNETWIEVLARPLGYAGEPNSDSDSQGRFLARINGFIDPAIYTAKRKITVRGQLESTLVRHIGEHPYRFPLVQVQTHYLWPKQSKTNAPRGDPWYPYPSGYDPFYGAYPPYYFDPYLPHRHHRYPH